MYELGGCCRPRAAKLTNQKNSSAATSVQRMPWRTSRRILLAVGTAVPAAGMTAGVVATAHADPAGPRLVDAPPASSRAALDVDVEGHFEHTMTNQPWP